MPTLEYDYKHNGERLLRMLRSQYPDYHPIMAVARIAHAAESAEELDTALKAHSTVLRYVEPELKAVEVTLNGDRRRAIEVTLFGEVTALPDDENSGAPPIDAEPLLLAPDLEPAEATGPTTLSLIQEVA